MKAAMIGGGLIGGGWAARFLLNGWDVAVYDRNRAAAEQVEQVVAVARESLPKLYDRPLPTSGELIVSEDIAAAVDGVDWIQESVPERVDVKFEVLCEISQAAAPDAIIASSTSGFQPSQLAEAIQGSERFLVAHPFNPVYLLPLVEVVPSRWTSTDVVARATKMLAEIGMHPLLLKREIDGFLGNRLQEAMWREALWLVHDGVATTAEIDDAIKYGFGLRTAQMGQFETFRIAGGERGMAHFLAQFGPHLASPLSHLMDVPALDDRLIGLITEQNDEQCGHLSIRDQERLRDQNLVGILRALRVTKSGAGGTILKHEDRIKNQLQTPEDPANG